MDKDLDETEKKIKICKSGYFFIFSSVSFIFFNLLIFLFILRGGIYLDSLFRRLLRNAKMTTGNGLKVACSNIVLLFLPKCSCKI